MLRARAHANSHHVRGFKESTQERSAVLFSDTGAVHNLCCAACDPPCEPSPQPHLHPLAPLDPHNPSTPDAPHSITTIPRCNPTTPIPHASPQTTSLSPKPAHLHPSSGPKPSPSPQTPFNPTACSTPLQKFSCLTPGWTLPGTISSSQHRARLLGPGARLSKHVACSLRLFSFFKNAKTRMFSRFYFSRVFA